MKKNTRFDKPVGDKSGNDGNIAVLSFRIHHPTDKQNTARIIVADEKQEWMVGPKDRCLAWSDWC